MTYTLRCQDMDDEHYDSLDKAMRAAEYIWSRMTEKERAECEVLEVWDDDADEAHGPEHSWPVEGSIDAPVEDRIILDVDDHLIAITVPHFEDDVWEAIDRYDTENGTDLWCKLTEGDVVGVNLPEYADVPEADPSELPQRVREATADMRVGVSGHSLILKVTEQARMLGIGRGDIVSVTIRRKD